MAGIQSPFPIQNSVLDYLKNAFQIGAQATHTEPPPKDCKEHDEPGFNTEDNAEISLKRGAQSGSQTGLARFMMKKEDRNRPDSTGTSNPQSTGASSQPFCQYPSSPGPSAPPSGGGSLQTSTASAALLAQNDALQSNETYIQMAIERQKHWYKIFETLQSLQNDIMTFISEAGMKRAKMMDRIAAKWASVLGEYELK